MGCSSSQTAFNVSLWTGLEFIWEGQNLPQLAKTIMPRYLMAERGHLVIITWKGYLAFWYLIFLCKAKISFSLTGGQQLSLELDWSLTIMVKEIQFGLTWFLCLSVMSVVFRCSSKMQIKYQLARSSIQQISNCVSRKHAKIEGRCHCD